MHPPSDNPTYDRYRSIKGQADANLAWHRQTSIPTIHIGMATCGLAAGAQETFDGFTKLLAERNIEARLHRVGCIGHCYAEPVVIIDHPASGFPPILYPQVTSGKARMLTRRFIEEGDPLFEHLLGATVDNELIPPLSTFPRFSHEVRYIMATCGQIDPFNIDEYIARSGYSALARALQYAPQQIIASIAKAGLRGLGGAGFPTGKKWQQVRDAAGKKKICICNADEGDPGAYMDRTLLESNPHQVLEGLALGAYAVGAEKASIYIRAEYPLAIETIESAISQARRKGLLGSQILGADFNLEVDVFRGSGAFVCGEETALIRSMEGFRGMPRHRPPYPAQSGLNNQPTLINNVKTLASIAAILNKGADWFRQVGTAASPGTAVFSVVGSVIHPGLVEIPMGATIGHLIFDLCGGIPNQKRFKAIQIGGPSGGCLSAAHLDTPIDFDSLTEAGAMMGSGGIVVMDETTCPIEIARYFVDFTQKESCGKCTFCRVGTYHMLTILERLTRGEGHANDLDILEALCHDVKHGSLCGLGKTAPNPVLTALRFFRDEFEAHLEGRRCPGMSCRSLTAFYIDLDKCARGCDACVGCCPVDAVFTTSTRKKGIDQQLCVKCGECEAACPPEYDAVKRISPAAHVPIVERPEPPEGKE
jgi:NADH-quinone oxidoreductase subunit F